MKQLARHVRELIARQGRSWMVRTVLVVLLALGLSRVLSWFVEGRVERDWERFAEGRASAYLEDAAREFTDQQRELRRMAVQVGSRPAVQEALRSPHEKRAALFAEAIRWAKDFGAGVEVYDRSGELVAWSGRSGVPQRREIRIALDGQMSSYVTRTPIDAQLFVATPVRSGYGILGVVLIRRQLEADAPLASRFTAGPGLTEKLEGELGVPVEFDFSPAAALSKDGRYASAVLYGIDSARVGVVSVMRPSRSEYLDRLGDRFQAFDSGLILVLLGILTFWAWTNLDRRSSTWIRLLGITVLLWAVRYALLFLEIPSGIVTWSLFDPGMFASKFGGGLAKSVGELLITVLFAAVNTAVIVRGIAALPAGEGRNSPWSAVWRTTVAGIPLTVLLFWSLRGYAAVVQSAVFDSSMEYLNLRSIFPSFGLAVMLFNLLLLGFAFLVLCVGLTWIVARWANGGGNPAFKWVVWLLLALIFVLASVLFGMPGSTPLMSWAVRFAFGAAVLVLTMFVARAVRRGGTVFSASFALPFLVLSALQLYPLLYEFSQEHDRHRIETMVQDLLRPVDTWFSLVVQEGLRSFSSEEAQAIVQRGDENEIGRLAYTRWVQNPACREGYTAIFTYFDASGTVKSRFAIGGELSAAMAVDTTLLIDNVREVTVREVGRGVNANKVYAGLTDITGPDGRLLGFGQVTVAAAQQTLFRGETPMILRAGVRGSLQSFYRPVTLTEYRDGRALPQSDAIMPAGQTLPAELRETLRQTSNGAVWLDEGPVESEYETGFFRRPESSDEVLAVGVQRGGTAGHVIGLVKVLIHAAFVGILLLLVFTVPAWIRHRQVIFTFRGKLQAAMLVTAMVPLVILTWSAAVYTTDRLLEESARTLEDETSTVAAYISEQEGTGTQQGFQLDRQSVEEIAAELNTDFIVYEDGVLKATSRPELFDLGILDRRLSGSAYASLVLQGRPFTVEREKIGQAEYAVGYRPLQDSTGRLSDVIAVPTLFRQERVEEESTRRNAVLFGVYAVVLLGVFVLATLLANRIAAPIQQLTAATRRVSGGDLDVRVDVPGADGELKQLIDSFDAMTRDLKRNREELVTAERELAWKEMAKQVAHEIKNPLTPMKLSVQHLRQAFHDRAGNLDEIMETVTKTIIDQIETLSRIASEFSHFGRMPKRHMEECDLQAVLQESAQLFEQDRNILFSYDFASSLPPIIADREELRRAFINLIRNGIQAMDGKGRIDIRTAREESGISITIRDEGKGIPEEMRGKLFQPNFSTKTDGMGLGLAIVKKTIDDLGGTVELLPVEGKGTVARIFLPLTGKEEE
jgi:two-component system nitrogen regulation sensor histidine kinase NtrY